MKIHLLYFSLVKPQTFEVLDVTMVRAPFGSSPPGTLTTFGSKPGVSDPEMEQLINEKVDTFWRGVEGGVSKRGQV